MADFTNKTVFITGAAKGQGRAVALALAEEGANIIAFDLGEKIAYPAYNRSSNKDLEQLKDDVIAKGGKILIYAGDVRKAEDVKEAVELGVKEFGTIDILFSNAGIAAYGNTWELTEEQWDAMIDINLRGGWLVSKYVIPHMIEAKKGVIIYNSSVAGLRGFNRMGHYSASKHGLVGLTKSQAIELAPYGIRVVSLHPTGVNTPMNDGLAELEGTTPTEIAERSAGNLLRTPWLETEDIVEAFKYIASDRARYLTGSQFVLDAGLLTA
ncbi:MAG: mycofactocin-coupled SDR family oxidoreductase [Lachnospiraceae bacterium]|nr:mycofactocin-coupled SDR family oxidoreductase [Lachnospiraceae bacterium]MBR3516110.1 mycofactocin-coupled SDR family oxidoreductase [Lachnospiraceae bacterium]